MNENEQTTTLADLDASLQDLVKAAERITGEPLMKGDDGVQIEHSGTYGSDGPQGGGTGSVSDAGSLEQLMIGKLTAQGFNAAQIAGIVGMMKDVSGGSFFQHQRPSPSGKMKGKADDDFAEEDDEDEDDEDEDEEEMEGYRRTKKSFAKSFMDDEDISDAVDVSAFLESFVARTTEALDSIAKSHRKSLKARDRQFIALAKSVVGLATLAKSQDAVIKELGRRLGVVERTPAAPKGQTTLSGAKALAKSLPGEVGFGGERLKKSELSAVLTYMNLEKGMKEIAGRKIATDIVPLVDSGFCPPEVEAEVMNFLRRNPGEASLAKSYA